MLEIMTNVDTTNSLQIKIQKLNQISSSTHTKSTDTNGNLDLQFENELLWLNTNQNEIYETVVYKFQKLIENKYKIHLETYNDLYKWSIQNNVDFWREFWHFSGIIHSKPYEQVLDQSVGFDEIPEWFHGSLLNYAENLLKCDDDEKVAIYTSGEHFSEFKSITFKNLRQRVKKFQNALRKAGITRGDRVVGYLPNCIECIEALLATVSLGAIWSCASPDFGSKSVVERFNQIQPKLAFSVTSVAYNGKIHDHKCKLNDLIDGVGSIERVVLIPFLDELDADSTKDIPKGCLLKDFLNETENSDENSELVFEQVPFNHPLTILYSSGTTGIPKCIVHSHGGTLIQHLKEHLLHGNMSQQDIIFYYTTTGWMMFNWLLTSLAVGATIVLYDGSPVLPKESILWDIIDKLNVTMFGTSAKWLSIMEEKNIHPIDTHKLANLKIIYSTGSPLKPNSFEYVYKYVKENLLLGSITGGTDIISLFCGHHINLPVYKGEIQCRHLGMAVECWNEDGKSVLNECGELVCTKPFPSMPVYFWNDKNNHRYRSSYFEKFKGVWAHGDFCMINEITGGVIMFGRSDGTLNPNGVRFGTAEIYNIVEAMHEIDDSLCIAQRNPQSPEEERVILFVKLPETVEFNQTLENKIKTKIRTSLSARHVPNIILPIKEIPYTLNGKKVEVPIRRIIEGNNIIANSSIANPQSFDLFRNIDLLNKW